MIDKMLMPTVPAQFDWRDSWTMWDKIQELIEKVNELESIIGENGNDGTIEDTNLTQVDINDLRNELCLKCGKYKDAHLGACDGCRWRKE